MKKSLKNYSLMKCYIFTIEKNGKCSKPSTKFVLHKSKGSSRKITLRIAPVLIMVSDLQYKRDGIMNGVREYMDSCNLVIWVILRHKKI